MDKIDKNTLAVTEDMVKEILPDEQRRKEGPYAVFECFEEIPCNPCYTACKTGAVKTMKNINEIPRIIYEKCTGCGLCVSNCPGLACFVIDETYSREKALIKIPYELLPLPEAGQSVTGLDRGGRKVCTVEVIKVQKDESLDNTNIITIAVPKKYVQKVRNIKIRGEPDE